MDRYIMNNSVWEEDIIRILGKYPDSIRFISFPNLRMIRLIIEKYPRYMKYIRKIDYDDLRCLLRDNIDILKRCENIRIDYNNKIIERDNLYNRLLLSNVYNFRLIGRLSIDNIRLILNYDIGLINEIEIDNNTLIKLIKENINILNYKKIDDKMKRELLEYDVRYIEYMEYDLELIKLCIKKDVSKVLLLKEKLSDNELIELNPLVLKYKKMSYDLCLKGLSINGLALEYIKNQNKKLCDTAVLNTEYALKYVLLKNYEIELESDKIMNVLKEDVKLVRYIKNRDEKIKDYCIRKDGLTLLYFDSYTRDELKLSYYSNYEIIKRVKIEEDLMYELIEEENVNIIVFINGGYNIEKKKIIDILIKNPVYFEEIESIEEDILLELVKIDYKVLEYIVLEDIELNKKLIDINGLSIIYMSNITNEMYAMSVINNPKIINLLYKKVNNELYNYLCKIIIKNDISNLENIENIPDSICYKIINDNINNFILINNPSDDICKYVLNINPEYIVYIKNKEDYKEYRDHFIMNGDEDVVEINDDDIENLFD